MRQNLNLLLAALWLVIAGGLVYESHVQPDAPFLRLFGTNLSPVWLAYALVGYNLLRWWLIRKQQSR